MAKFVQRPRDNDTDVHLTGPMETSPLSIRFPAITEYLTVGRYEDGSERETSTLLVLWEEGKWKCSIHDRAGGRAAWFSADTLDELLVRAEAALAGDEAEWRRKAGTPAGRPPKKS